MVDKKWYKRKAVLLSALCTAFTVSLAAFSYISFAWFTSQRTATVNFSSLKVGGGMEVSVDYCKLNINGGKSSATASNGYKLSEAPSLVTSNFSSSYAYDNLFTSGDTAHYATSYMAPLYASTFAIKVSNPDGNNPVTPVLYLTGFTTPRSTTDAIGEGTGTYTLGDYFSLNQALRVYCSYSTGTASEIQTFLTKSFVDSSITTEGSVYDTTDDVFKDSTTSAKYVMNKGATTSNAVSCEDKWATGSSIAGGGVGYFLITIYLSNDSSTFYSKVGETTVGSSTVSLWQTDATTGNSNPYQSISGFAFSNLLINPE